MQAKALYNLLRYNWLSNKSLQIEPWQVENLRELPIETLFARLETFSISLNEERFLRYAEAVNTPEELIEYLWVRDDKDLSEFDQSYLLLFELWRRLLPEKQSISLFCDELDYRIALYDEDLLENEELLLESIDALEDILDETVDEGEEPKKIFSLIASYCAHDLENFLYDYIVGQIESGNELCASELIEGFYQYVSDQRWFHFLRIVLFMSTNGDEAQLVLRRFLEEIQENPDFDLLLEVANYLTHRGDMSLFMQTIKQSCALIEKEGQFQEILETVAKFYQCCDRDKEYHLFNTLAVQRSHKNPEDLLDQNDKDYHAFKAQLCE